MQKLARFLKVLFTRFFEDQCPMRAASLTFTMLLSIVPLVIFAFYILSFFPQLQVSGKQLEQLILQNFVASSATVIAQHLQIFVTNMQTFSWGMVLTLASVGLLMIFNIVYAVNGVWHVTMEKHFAFSFFLYLILIVVAPIGFALLILLSSYLTSLPLLSHFVEIDVVRKPLISLSPFLMEWIAFSLFHWIMPSCRVMLRYAVIAGLVTAILFEIAKWGFVTYIQYFPTYQLVYGALAAIPIFFLWIYVSWLIVILGALVCQLLQTGFR